MYTQCSLLVKTGSYHVCKLTSIFNQSLSTGVVPEDWHQANIFALHKKGSKELPENYRPISLTSICSKMLEHIVFSNVSHFLESHNILTPRQHGFRLGHSCESQLILAVDDWAQAIDQGLQTDIAIFDFSKAFDSVPHHRLLLKIEAYGIRGTTLQWIRAFLTDRRQRVVQNGAKSSWQPVISGVPQGTVLGPLLFLLYINDIVNNISSEIRLFADDCVLYRRIHCLDDCRALQSDIDTLLHWSRTWQMQFNNKKCYILPVTRKRSKIGYDYCLGEDRLSEVKSYPYLGITVSSDLRWKEHVMNVSAKANRTLGFVRRNCYFCTRDAKATAYTALVRPVLEYAAAAWDPYTKTDINRLEMVQRRAARFVSRDYRQTTSATALINQLGWTTLADRRKNNRLTIFYRAYNHSSAITLDHLQRPTRGTRQTSDSSSFINIGSRTDAYKYSFFPRTVLDWGLLPIEARTRSSVDLFKKSLLTCC